MLRELHITGLGVIDDLDLEFDPGLNVLTGETGAGKTMVTVGLSLALGARGSATLVRPGATAARVQALFELPDGAATTAGGWADEGELLLSRAVGADGRGSARIGGQLATTSVLSEVGSALVELHGQHQAQRLLSAATQTAFLDRFAGQEHLDTLDAYADSFRRLRAARTTFEELRTTSRDRERELDLLAYQVREIEAVGPRPDESAALAAEEARLAHVERLLEASGGAHEALAADGRAGDILGSVHTMLEEAGALDPDAEELADRAGSLAAEAAELARDVRRYSDELSADPDRLQQVRERIAALRTLQRKYGETDTEVLGFLQEASEQLAGLAGADDRLDAITSEVAELEASTSELSGRVSRVRRAAAPELARGLEAELRQLGMPGALVEVAVEPVDELASMGAERVEIRFAAGRGHPAMPLARTASGGELSRTMLACRSVLADLDEVPTLVFDEVDAGIGGEAGLAVGRRLARLARDKQVLVVTHLPQIACFADRHIRVRKSGGLAAVQVLDEDERVRELSRMLAGLERSEGAVSHAEELLTEAARAKSG